MAQAFSWISQWTSNRCRLFALNKTIQIIVTSIPALTLGFYFIVLMLFAESPDKTGELLRILPMQGIKEALDEAATNAAAAAASTSNMTFNTTTNATSLHSAEALFEVYWVLTEYFAVISVVGIVMVAVQRPLMIWRGVPHHIWTVRTGQSCAAWDKIC